MANKPHQACCYLKFPIPMRGNESPVRVELPEEAEEFPIPMRGNERMVRSLTSWSRSLVSDPHEG